MEHPIFLILTFILMGGAFGLIYGLKPSFKTVFTVACICCVISEVVKTFSCMKFTEIDGQIIPYISMAHVPLHLCSIQILFIFLVRFMKNDSRAKSVLVAFMFPTFIIGAALALAIPGDISFTNPQSYQFFLYHGMLIVLGIYIMTQKEIKILPKHYFSTLAILSGLAFMSIYTNSILGHYSFENGKVVLKDITNFFFVIKSPLPSVIPFTEKWHWYLYIICIVLIAFISIALLYLPIFIKALKEKRKINNANN